MNCDTQIRLDGHPFFCLLRQGHADEHTNRRAVYSSEGLTYATIKWASPKVPGMRAGRRVRLNDGRLGKLLSPRGCLCGPNKEACWDILLDDETGIQAHGGTFSLVENSQNT